MKKIKIGLSLFVAVFLTVLFSCEEPYLSAPVVPTSENNGRSVEAPGALTATHGEFRSITLSWEPIHNAAFYYMYRANSPLDVFVRCGETTANQFEFKTTPGATVYYRVSSVSQNGTESSISNFVKGTSLAQPIISDITDINEAGATVTWYMENAADDTYKSSLLYTVNCYIGKETTPIAQLTLDGAELKENKAYFSNLSPRTNYEYEVEAYLRNNQDVREKSDRVDAATARRTRPAAPINLRASEGTSISEIVLSFELPDPVDFALGDNQFEPKPVYYKIYKRTKGTNGYLQVCDYFGSITPIPATSTTGIFFGPYNPGETRTWTDTTVSRGVEYEYYVQAYVDDTTKSITSDASKAYATGWTLSVGSLSRSIVVYTSEEGSPTNTGANFTLSFNLDTKGKTYSYSLIENKYLYGDEVGTNLNFVDPIDTKPGVVKTYNELQSYDVYMDPRTERGRYKFTVEIKLNDDTAVIDTVSNVGFISVNDDKDSITVKGFSVQDGYPDKFVLEWDNYGNQQYKILVSDDNLTWSDATNNEIGGVAVDGDGSVNKFSYDYTTNVEPGTSKYFAVQPYQRSGGTLKMGEADYGNTTTPYQTLGTPSDFSTGGDPSYSDVTLIWKEAQKADAYRIKYGYSSVDEYDSVFNSSELTETGGIFTHTFAPFGKNLNAADAGKPMKFKIEALNKGLQQSINSTAEIKTVLNTEVTTQLVGPALLNPVASKATSASAITVSWNRIQEAEGYYVIRRQFNMNNTAEEGAEAIVYYVPNVTSTIPVKGIKLDVSSGTGEDASVFWAGASFNNNRYTLSDDGMNDGDYGTHVNFKQEYRNQQNDIVRGNPYRYYVVPVININNDSPGSSYLSIGFDYLQDGSNKNTGINKYNIGDVSYTTGAAALEKEGFTVGFGQNVTATKGTYTAQGSNENSGIRITWEAPPLLAGAGVTPQYNLYRRASNGGSWGPIATPTETQYVSTAETEGIVYEYIVGINGTLPQNFTRFIDHNSALLDEIRGIPKSHGYLQKKVKIASVSRDIRTVGSNFAEEVKWYSAGIENTLDDNNWGIDGYTVFVMNRNIDGNWHDIAELSSNIPNQENHTITVAANTKYFEGLDLLRVLRDYRHYFKVRSYVLNDFNEKVYSPDPDWNYETKFFAGRNNQDNTNFIQDDFVKWGARQITATEFTKIATLAITWGIHHQNGARGDWSGKSYLFSDNWKSFDSNSGSSNGASGRIGTGHNGSTRWWFYFDNYKPAFSTKANPSYANAYSTIFVSVNTSTNTSDGRVVTCITIVSGQYPREYQLYGGSSYINITGPSCVSPLYTGEIRFNNLTWTGGNAGVIYPSGSTTVQITGAQANTPLPFQSQDVNYRQDGDAWY